MMRLAVSVEVDGDHLARLQVRDEQPSVVPARGLADPQVGQEGGHVADGCRHFTEPPPPRRSSSASVNRGVLVPFEGIVSRRC